MADVLFASSSAADADFTCAQTNVSDAIGVSLDSPYPMGEASGTRFDAIGSEDLAEINTVGQDRPVSC